MVIMLLIPKFWLGKIRRAPSGAFQQYCCPIQTKHTDFLQKTGWPGTRRGIYPTEITTISEDSRKWHRENDGSNATRAHTTDSECSYPANKSPNFLSTNVGGYGSRNRFRWAGTYPQEEVSCRRKLPHIRVLLNDQEINAVVDSFSTDCFIYPRYLAANQIIQPKASYASLAGLDTSMPLEVKTQLEINIHGHSLNTTKYPRTFKEWFLIFIFWN